MIFIIDDNTAFATCVQKAAGEEAKVFQDAVAAMREIDESGVPELIFMDILLTGPDGISFLNEMASYEDTGRVPIVITTELPVKMSELSEYGVVGVLNKDTMTPGEVRNYVQKFARR